MELAVQETGSALARLEEVGDGEDKEVVSGDLGAGAKSNRGENGEGDDGQVEARNPDERVPQPQPTDPNTTAF